MLTNNGVSFLRMANDRGWTFENDADGGGGGPLFVRVAGEVVEERCALSSDVYLFNVVA